jgi:hypothetical protein
MTMEIGTTSPWPAADAARSAQKIGDLPYHLQSASCGPYEEPPDRAFVFRVGVQDAAPPLMMMVAGVSPRLPLNDDYRGFFELVATTVSAAQMRVRAQEDE